MAMDNYMEKWKMKWKLASHIGFGTSTLRGLRKWVLNWRGTGPHSETIYTLTYLRRPLPIHPKL